MSKGFSNGIRFPTLRTLLPSCPSREPQEGKSAMSERPNRGGNQLSPRTIVLGIALVSIAVGLTARSAPLIHKANVHELERMRLERNCSRLESIADGVIITSQALREDKVFAKWHADMANQYRQAAWIPWMRVDDRRLPEVPP
jgi:hypothetical protein